MVQVEALIKGVRDEIIEMIEVSFTLDVESIRDLMITLLSAFIIIIKIINLLMFNKTEIKVISFSKK